MRSVRPELILLALLAVLLLPFGRALASYDRPSGRVNDFANIISPEKRALLEAKLNDLDGRSGIELVVVTVPDLEGMTVEDYTVTLAKKWKIGKRDKNNGVVFLIAPKEKKVRIEVGYGLEGDLTDALSRRILSTVVVPYFRQGDFSGGIYAGVDAITGVLAHGPPGAAAGQAARRSPDPRDTGSGVGKLVFIAILFVIIILLSIFGRRRRGFYGGGWGPGGGGFFGGGGGSSGGSDGFSGGGGDFGGGGSGDSWD